MTSTMAATWPRPASTSAWVRTADECESRTAAPPPPQALAGPGAPAGGAVGRGRALRSRQVPRDSPAASGLELQSGSVQF